MTTTHMTANLFNPHATMYAPKTTPPRSANSETATGIPSSAPKPVLPATPSSPREDNLAFPSSQPSRFTAPMVGALVGGTISALESLSPFSIINFTFSTTRVSNRFTLPLLTPGGLPGTFSAIVGGAAMGALLGIFYKGGNPFSNWEQPSHLSLGDKLFGGRPVMLDPQTRQDREEIHNAKLRAAAWGLLLPGAVQTCYRLFGQDPVALAMRRADVQSGRRTLESGVQHEVQVRDAQLRVANASMIPNLGGGLALLGLACFEKPDSEGFNSVL